METRLGHILQKPVTSGAPPTWIARERFAGRHEQQLNSSLGVTQFGVNRVTLEPGSRPR